MQCRRSPEEIRESATERQRVRREKLRQDPDAYALYLQYDRERKKEKRASLSAKELHKFKYLSRESTRKSRVKKRGLVNDGLQQNQEEVDIKDTVQICEGFQQNQEEIIDNKDAVQTSEGLQQNQEVEVDNKDGELLKIKIEFIDISPT